NQCLAGSLLTDHAQLGLCCSLFSFSLLFIRRFLTVVVFIGFSLFRIDLLRLRQHFPSLQRCFERFILCVKLANRHASLDRICLILFLPSLSQSLCVSLSSGKCPKCVSMHWQVTQEHVFDRFKHPSIRL